MAVTGQSVTNAQATHDGEADAISQLPLLVFVTAINFKGWKKLPSNHPGDWASIVQITYDNYQVEIHDLQRAPKQFTDLMATLNNYAKQAVAQSTRPASAPPN